MLPAPGRVSKWVKEEGCVDCVLTAAAGGVDVGLGHGWYRNNGDDLIKELE